MGNVIDQLSESKLAMSGGVTIVYDDECPFCKRFVDFYRLKSAVDNVNLVDARKQPSLLVEMAERGMNLNDGMIVFVNGVRYYGPEAMHILAILSSEQGVFNRLNRFLFVKPKLAAFAYPLLVFLRKLVLVTLRRKSL